MLKRISCLILGVYSLLTGEQLTLSKAENKAIRCSYELRAAFYTDQAKKWEELNTLSNYMPSVSYSGGINRMDSDALINQLGGEMFPGFFLPEWMNNFSHKITINQPIFNGGAELFAIRIARETKKAIDLQMNDLKLDAIYNTRKAYFDCMVASEQKSASIDDLSWTIQNMKKAKIRHEGGQIPLTDVLQWESEVAKKETAVAMASAAYNSSILNLFHCLGIPTESADTSVELQSYDQFEPWYLRGQAEMMYGVDDNLQFQASTFYLKVAEQSKKIAMSNFMPSLNAFVQTSWLSDSSIIPERSAGWMAGISFNMTLFSGFRNGTNYKKVTSDYNKTVIDQEKTRNQIQMNIDRIKAFYAVSYEGVKAARIQRELMEKQLQLMQERYDGGLVNQSQLLEVALGSRMARVGYIQKLLECLLLEAEYLRHTGKLEVTP